MGWWSVVDHYLGSRRIDAHVARAWVVSCCRVFGPDALINSQLANVRRWADWDSYNPSYNR